GKTGRILRPNLKFLFNKKVDAFFLYLYNRTKKIYCLDFPHPYTLARHNILEADSFNGKLQYCGLIKGKDPQELPSKEEIIKKLELNPDLPTFYFGLSGPNKYPLINFFTKLFDGCKDKNIVITTGTPSSSLLPYRNNEFRLFHWYPVREELIKIADVVVARAGLSTISEILTFGKKSLLLPELQPEQMENAHSLESRGLCSTIHPEALNEKIFNTQLERLLENNQMIKRLKDYQKLCNQSDALSVIVSDFN
ncbi:MAG: glycosyltransferase, partial [Promethearchaeota archaeon]